jgi:uncharacterized membrane protein YdjX (TVP38/TMEM64 family)
VWPVAAAGGFLLAMVAVGRAIDVGRHLEAAQGWTAALGILAPAVYVIVYVAATLIGVPGMPFTLLSPLLLGVGPAFVVMVVGSAMSAALAFLIARYLARDTFAERLAGTDGFARLSAMIPMNAVLVLGAGLFYDAATRGTASWPLLGLAGAAALALVALAALGRKAFARA